MSENEKDGNLRTLSTEVLPGDDLTEDGIIRYVMTSTHFRECNIISVSRDIFDVLMTDVEPSPFFDRSVRVAEIKSGFAGRIMTRPVFLDVSAEERTVSLHHLLKQGESEQQGESEHV